MSGEHTKKKNPELLEATETVLRSTYMNDSMNSKSNDVEVIKLYQDFSKLLGSAGMYVRKGISNSVVVIKQMLEEDRATISFN